MGAYLNCCVDSAAEKQLAFKLFVLVLQKKSIFVLLPNLDGCRVLKSSSLVSLQLSSSSLPSILSF